MVVYCTLNIMLVGCCTGLHGATRLNIRAGVAVIGASLHSKGFPFGSGVVGGDLRSDKFFF